MQTSLRFALPVSDTDHAYRDSQARPNIVVIDAGRHHIDKHLVIGNFRDIDNFLPKGPHGFAKTLFIWDLGFPN